MNRRRFLFGLGASAAAGAGCLSYARFIEPGWLEITERRLPRPGPGSDRSLPSIVQISDLHLDRLGDEHHEIAAEVARRAPDLIAFTGDSVDREAGLPVLRRFLGLLPPETPKFAILGNWEHWGHIDFRVLGRIYESAGCRLLVNRSVVQETPRGAIRISGVDDLVGGRPDLRPLMSAGRDGRPHLLLAHCPAHRDRIPDPRAFDLVLSGHTHGGQVQILGHAPLVPRGSGRYVEGWYRDGAPPMYVSRGIGTSVLPVRFGSRPEVVFFTA